MAENLSEANHEIMVVEDEIEIRELISLHLSRKGYRVTECETAEEALRKLEIQSYSVVILDWMLPNTSGVDIIQDIKKIDPKTNILMVTARTEPEDIVLGLEKGADDFLSKPFEIPVLMARIKALLRRSSSDYLSNGPKMFDELEVSGLRMNFNTYKVTLNKSELHLTPSEFKLLSAMFKNQGRVLTRDQLIDEIQGEDVNVTGRTVDTHVFGLRKKLGHWSENIETIRGVGYRVKMD